MNFCSEAALLLGTGILAFETRCRRAYSKPAIDALKRVDTLLLVIPEAQAPH